MDILKCKALSTLAVSWDGMEVLAPVWECCTLKLRQGDGNIEDEIKVQYYLETNLQ